MGKPYVESILQISEGRKFFLVASMSDILIFQKECDVGSSRWLNILVNFTICLPMSVLKYNFKKLFKDRITVEDGKPHLSSWDLNL